MPWSLRPATPDYAAQMADVMKEGFATYRAFAPQGWEPPDPRDEIEAFRQRLADPQIWCLVAEQEGDPAGHVAFMPARIHTHPSDEPGLAHFWQLFVRTPWWGTGLATELHAEAIREAAARGFKVMRLFTPAEQMRARRFYEREGWTVAGEPAEAPDLGIAVLEYRRAISISV